MCVGRYAEMMELSEAKRNHFEPLARSNLFVQMPATKIPILCIPAECDTTNRFKQTHITQIMLSHSAGMHICCAIFAGISLRLCYISLRSFRITFAAYLPTHIKSLRDFFQSVLNFHRDNLYSIYIIFGAGGNKRRGEPGGLSSLDIGVIGIYSLFLDELGDFPHEGAKTELWCEAVLLVEVVEHAVNAVVFHHHHHCGAH